MAWSTYSEPQDWISGWAVDGTDVVFPIASVPELDATEAAAAGDIRKVLFALCDQLGDVWYTIPTADRPMQMSVSRSTSTDEASGEQTKQYVFRFTTAPTSNEVVDEPV